MTKTSQETVKLVETRLQELIRCARMSAVSEIKVFHDGIEITVGGMITTPVMRAAVSLQECYPDGGVYVASRMGVLVLCVYNKIKETEEDPRYGLHTCGWFLLKSATSKILRK